MSQLDALLERSRSPGAFVERRRFSLSRDKAIDKLREFSLRNPRQYVLELIQSAVFSGATYIAVDAGHEQVLVAWVGGTPFDDKQLGSIFDHLFLDRGDLERRAPIQLAVALNALLQRRPKTLRVESGDGRHTVRLDLDRKGNGTVGVPESSLAGTYVLAEFGADWFHRFSGDAQTPEERLVEERCRFSPVPILLNGRAPFGYRASRKLAMPACPEQVPFDDGERFGVLAVPPRSGVSRGVKLVVGGVWITSVELPELGTIPGYATGRREPQSLTGVIADDRLRKTADHSDIVRERRFAEMLHAVQPHATALIGGMTRGEYQPPELPKLVGGVTVAEPLPDVIEQLEPRPLLGRQSLERIPEGSPVFRVRPEDTAALRQAADPARFPFPVLVVPDTQVPSLEEVAPQLAVHRLSGPEDVDFVRRMMERRQVVRRIAVRYEDPRKDFIRGTLHLAHHVEGAPPLLGDPASGDVPLLVSSGGSCLQSQPAQLGLPRVLAHLELDAGVQVLPDETIPGLDEAVLEAAWGLLPTDPAEFGGPARSLLLALFAAHASPHFVERDGATVLEVDLPGPDDDRSAQLRRLPLARVERGPELTFDDLVGLVGTEQVRTLLDADDLNRLLPLEERLGVGHLTTRALSAGALCLVGRRTRSWRPPLTRQRDLEELNQIVWASHTLDTVLDEPGWRMVELGIPGVGAAVREGVVQMPGGWDDGLAELLKHLSRGLRDGVSLAMGDVDLQHPRIRGMLRVTCLRLAAHQGRLLDEPLLQAPDGTSWASLREWRGQAGFAVWPRHGPAVLERGVLLVDRDEVAILEGEGQLPLRFDDPPGLWDTLADPAAPGWLVRTEVDIPGLRGWLGLRDPFDDTTGVFLQSEGVRIALPDVDAQVPCHGLLRTLGGHVELSRTQNHLLALARTQLYREVEGMAADGELGEGPRSVAGRYHAAFVQGLARERRAREEVSRQRTRQAGNDVTRDMQRRLFEASGGMLADELIQIFVDDGEEDDAPVSLDQQFKLLALNINRNHPLGRQALTVAGRARELVLLELARRAAIWGAESGRPFDLLEAQRILVAQRMGEG